MTYTQPLTLLFLSMAAAGLYGLRQHRRTISWWIAVFGLLGLVVLTWPPAVALIARPLVARFGNTVRPRGEAEVIVVLAGAVNYPTRERPYILMGRDTYRRVQHAAWLFHNWKSVPILATGGPESSGSEAVSVIMRRMLEREGVPSSMIWTEERSRSTYENALYSAKILREHGAHEVALVVEADSMLRAVKCFRKQGLSVTPAVCLFRDGQFGAVALLPGWESMYRQEIILHEGLGLLWYWLHDWI